METGVLLSIWFLALWFCGWMMGMMSGAETAPAAMMTTVCLLINQPHQLVCTLNVIKHVTLTNTRGHSFINHALTKTTTTTFFSYLTAPQFV